MSEPPTAPPSTRTILRVTPTTHSSKPIHQHQLTTTPLTPVTPSTPTEGYSLNQFFLIAHPVLVNNAPLATGCASYSTSRKAQPCDACLEQLSKKDQPSLDQRKKRST